MFSGIGGFELGISRILPNAKCIGYSEVNKYAIEVYVKHFDHKNYGDATKINTRELEDFDMLVGGFPCQAFSFAGKRQGFKDTRGTLFFEIIRICKDKKPRIILLENVKGLLSHEDGRTFQTILRSLANIGYRVEWQVLNSKNFGVPQNRERVFIIGHLRGESTQQIFPVTGDAGQIIKQSISNTSQGTGLYAVLTPDRLNKRQDGRRFKENEEPMFTLTGQDRHGVYDGYKIRRLTPIECERLQGFPDNWTEGLSDTQRYKCLGNAITVNVTEAIIKLI